MNRRDLELLSSYLDGELSTSDSTRLEARLKTDPQLVSVLDDLRAARSLLRKLPKRRAPRNFTLTRRMVGLNPPLPRSYPAFRFATVVATLLFFFTFGINALAPQLAQPIGVGGGGGVEEPELFSAQAPAATEAPALEAAPTEAPAATEPTIGASDFAPQPTLAASEDDGARTATTPAAKAGEEGNAEVQDQLEAGRGASFIPTRWLLIFAGIAIVSAMFMAGMRRRASSRWK
jgi:anti-sigma factor RsiW